MRLRFSLNCASGDKADRTSKRTQEYFKASTKSVWSNHPALNLKGLWALGLWEEICRKTGWWSDTPPHPIHCLSRKSQSRKSAETKRRSNLLQIPSSPTLWLLRVGIATKGLMSTIPNLSNRFWKKLVKGSTWAWTPQKFQNDPVFLNQLYVFGYVEICMKLHLFV